MADAPQIPDEAETRAKWGDFLCVDDSANATAILGALDIVFGECDL